MQNPDPAKFHMAIAHGMKAEARADAPDVEVPFCNLHQRWPCHVCGTAHFEGCDCPVCVPVDASVRGARKPRSPRCLRCGAGPEWIE